jgi:hypothetical protein
MHLFLHSEKKETSYPHVRLKDPSDGLLPRGREEHATEQEAKQCRDNTIPRPKHSAALEFAGIDDGNSSIGDYFQDSTIT